MKTPTFNVQTHEVVSNDRWTEARKALLRKEKEFTRLRDQLSQDRRDLPWERVDKNYVFEGPAGKQSLSDLFGDSHQLIIYHFMFDPSWDEGCKSCSYWADNFNGIPVHLKARDVSFAAISRAPLAKIEAYRKRMGWDFLWASSFENDFNCDFNVTFSEEELAKDQCYYNYTMQSFPDAEAPGVSVFYKDNAGKIYHTYSAYSRGIDIINGAYNFLDFVPKGRDEGESTQRWVRRHDEYDH